MSQPPHHPTNASADAPTDGRAVPAAPANADETVIAATRLWLERAVIGLNLCPFAKAEHVHGRIRYVASAAEAADDLLDQLKQELLFLQAQDPKQVETTLLIHPHVLQDFLDFNDFLATADDLLVELELDGELQIASFHPDYQFAGTRDDDITNYTNRSPYPTLHLIREASIDRAIEAFPDAETIYERNMQTMERLGTEGWRRLFAETVPDTPDTQS